MKFWVIAFWREDCDTWWKKCVIASASILTIANVWLLIKAS